LQPAGSEVAAAYDVNGDAISDLLLHDQQATPPRFRLLLTSRPPDVFDFVESDCAALRELPSGRLFLRDLDGDGVQDFVVGTNDGVEAFLNRAEGVRRVLDYHMSPTVRAPLINLGLADLNGDEQADLVASFDRVISDTTFDYELRVQAFVQEQARFWPGLSLSMITSGLMMVEPGMLYTAYLTTGKFRPDERDSALVVAQNPLSSSFRFVQQTRFAKDDAVQLRSGFGQHTHQVLAVPRPGAHALVVAVGEFDFFLLDLNSPGADPAHSEPGIVAQGALQFGSGPSHELGGGAENQRYFVYDIDRDGDLDFMECAMDGGRLALHLNSGNQTFELPQILDVDVAGSVEAPFIQLGPIAAFIGRTRTQRAQAIYTLIAATE
jgi:hypothetical protein